MTIQSLQRLERKTWCDIFQVSPPPVVFTSTKFIRVPSTARSQAMSHKCHIHATTCCLPIKPWPSSALLAFLVAAQFRGCLCVGRTILCMACVWKWGTGLQYKRICKASSHGKGMLEPRVMGAASALFNCCLVTGNKPALSIHPSVRRGREGSG